MRKRLTTSFVAAAAAVVVLATAAGPASAAQDYNTCTGNFLGSCTSGVTPANADGHYVTVSFARIPLWEDGIEAGWSVVDQDSHVAVASGKISRSNTPMERTIYGLYGRYRLYIWFGYWGIYGAIRNF